MGSSSDADLEGLLEYLKRNRGFDFTGYKRASLQRRVQKRMMAVHVESVAEYLDYLELHQEELGTLFNTILINVTSFFRDESTWDYLAAEVLPDLVAARQDVGQVRVWSAGCASGEEAYTLAMVLAEQMGSEAFRRQVKIYATDLDDEALAKGRQAAYTARDVRNVPPPMLARYFENHEERFVFRKDLRRNVIFGRHDLITDAPISRVDLLVCRNTLMYLNAETQNRILARFHFALNDGGILILGRAETLLTHASTFEPIDLKRRISRKVRRGDVDPRDRLMMLGSADDDLAPPLDAQLRAVALDTSPTAQIVVDRSGTLVLANERARAMFDITPADLGSPLHDLKLSYRPVELRSLIEQVAAEHRAVVRSEVEWIRSAGDTRWLDVSLMPLIDNGTLHGTSITFTDVSLSRRLQRDLERARQELESAYEELQSTNEELETTNEELQSTVEELETTNEELQSTNEELETMNEELQSTNEELQPMNDELRDRGLAVDRLNSFLQSILTSLRGAVMVLDTRLRVQLWNRATQDLWGLRQEEVVGQHFLDLDIGLPLGELRAPLKACIAGTRELIEMDLASTNRRGRPVMCHVRISPLQTEDGTITGAVVIMENQPADPLSTMAPTVGLTPS